jgi:FtsP/CotA-like multicopper oxidase with cupredoxin domain
MFQNLSRRRLLASGAVAAAAGLGGFGRSQRGAAAAATIPLRAVRRKLELRGGTASVFGLIGPDGQPGLTLDPGQRFAVDLVNETGEATIVHWHGQTPPSDQDGVAETGYAAAIPDGARRSYDFLPRPGTHWMHSHLGLQEQALFAAPLIVRSAEDVRRDAQEVTVLLQDFSFRDPRAILADLTKGTGMGGMDMGNMDMSQMGHDGAAMPAMADLNDVAYDAYLANGSTLEFGEVVTVDKGGRVLLRLINGATSTGFWIDLGISGSVIAVDGNLVQPVQGNRFPMAQGQRLDILLEIPREGMFVITAQAEGTRMLAGIALVTRRWPGVPKLASTTKDPAPPIDNSLEARLIADAPLQPKPVDVQYRLALTGGMAPYQWSIDGRSWKDRVPLDVRAGQRVAIELVNRSMMAHPMHLHGHHFQVTALNGTAFSGAVRDTVLVPVMGSVTIAFDASNSGRWLFHCHNLYHMATGMMTEVVYADA